MKRSEINYINCKDSYPLQLKGRMMVHSRPNQNQNMKNLLNYSNMSLDSQKQDKKNCKVVANSSIRKALADKIGDNHNLLSKKYQKSVLPHQDARSSRKRPQSVRTFKQQRIGTGINYLLEASQKAIFKGKQKYHAKQYHAPKRQSYGKKMVSKSQYEIPNYLQEIQKKQSFRSQSELKQNQINFGSRTIQMAKYIPQATHMRVQKDIHSSINRFQPEKMAQISKTKFSSQNQFKIGRDLGYETVQQRRVNCQKMVQIMGSSYCKKQQAQKIIKRDDWRKSSIVLQ